MPAADQARLSSDELEMRFVTQSPLRCDLEGALVDPLLNGERVVLAAAGGHRGPGLTRGEDLLLEGQALDGVLATEAPLGAFALNGLTVGLEEQVNALCHVCLLRACAVIPAGCGSRWR